MEVAGIEFHDSFPFDRKPLRRDVAVFPVVLTGHDHLFDRLPVVDREAEDVADERAELEHGAKSVAVIELGRGVEHVGEDAGRNRALDRFGGSAFLLQSREKLEQLAAIHQYVFHVDLQYESFAVLRVQGAAEGRSRGFRFAIAEKGLSKPLCAMANSQGIQGTRSWAL